MKSEYDPIISVAAEKLKELGIKAVIFDLDDTLIYTSEIFRGMMELYTEVVAEDIGLEPEVLGKLLSEINDAEYKTMGVSPRRWEAVVNKLDEVLNDKTGSVKENIEILFRIYKIAPRLRPGAKAILSLLHDAGMKVGLVTHANEEWTYRKLDQTSLWDYFDEILVANENGHKGKWHWNRMMEQLEVAPEQCLVTGDNLKGDILPAAELGARTIWMPSPWSVYREGEVPEDTVQIDKLSDWIDGLLRLKREK